MRRGLVAIGGSLLLHLGAFAAVSWLPDAPAPALEEAPRPEEWVKVELFSGGAKSAASGAPTAGADLGATAQPAPGPAATVAAPTRAPAPSRADAPAPGPQRVEASRTVPAGGAAPARNPVASAVGDPVGEADGGVGGLAAASVPGDAGGGSAGTAAATPEQGDPAAGAGGPPGGEAGSPGGSAGGPDGSGPGGVDLALLHARLSRSAAGCYPAAARRFRQQGTVELRFCLDGHGAVASAERLGTSGWPLLDRAALDCVLPRATPLPGPASCHTVAVVFDQPR